MKLMDKIHQVLLLNKIPDNRHELSRQIAVAVSRQPELGFDGTFRRERKEEAIKDRNTINRLLAGNSQGH